MENGEVVTGNLGPSCGGALLEQLAKNGHPWPIGLGWVTSPHDRWVALSVPRGSGRCRYPVNPIAEPANELRMTVQEGLDGPDGADWLWPLSRREGHAECDGSQGSFGFFSGGSFRGVEIEHPIDEGGEAKRDVGANANQRGLASTRR